MTFSPGETVGAYRIVEPLGQGGMATVFKAYHAALDRYVAIKVLHPAFKEDPNFLSRFNREARIVARLDHPNIIPIYDFAEYAGTPYLVMRYVEGKTLKAVLREGRLSLERTLAIIRPVADALAYAHEQGVLHRDIKPSNIIIAGDRHIYITDFGLARIAQAGESTLSQDMLIGTPQYISPEQAKGQPVSERSDIYSLGVVLFEMLTGRVPFSADTPYAVIHDHIYTPLPLPTSINPNLPPSVERVLLKALDKNPDARYATATDLFNALQQASGITLPAGSTLTPTGAPAAPMTPQPQPPTSTPPPAAISGQVKRGLNPMTCAVVAVLAVLLLLCIGMAINPQSPLRQTLKNIPPPAADSVRAARERVNQNPNDPVAHLQLADALARNRDYTEAFAEYDRAIALNPRVASPYLRAGALAEGINDLERAANYYKAGLQQLPDHKDLLLSQSDVLMKQKNYEDARALIERVLRADPGSAQAVWRMGEYYRATGKVAEALREFSRALVIDPNLPEAHFGLGMLAVQRGNTEEARRQFQIVINNPDSPPDLKDQAQRQLRQLGATK